MTRQDLYRGKDASTGTRANRHKRRLFYDADFVDVFCGERRPQRVKARLENVRNIERVWMTTRRRRRRRCILEDDFGRRDGALRELEKEEE